MATTIRAVDFVLSSQKKGKTHTPRNAELASRSGFLPTRSEREANRGMVKISMRAAMVTPINPMFSESPRLVAM
jgi:hypothetical protein